MTSAPGSVPSPAVARIAAELAESTGFLMDAAALGRLGRFIDARCGELALADHSAYLTFLRREGEAERSRLISALTITYTWFQRDSEQLELALGLLRDAAPPGETAAVWIAGCATGEEAFSLVMLAGRDERLSVLATDINDQALERARLGLYDPSALGELSPALVGEFQKRADGRFEVPSHWRTKVRFLTHNVLDAPPPSPSARGWDLILCRNVLLYFDRQVALSAMQAVGKSLSARGMLLLGANDFVYEAPEGLECLTVGGRVVLRKSREWPATAGAPPRASLPPRMVAVPIQVSEPSPRITTAKAGEPVPPKPRGALAEALLHLDAGRFKDAERLLSEVVDADPLSAEARLLLGVAAYSSESLDVAIGQLRAALFLRHEMWPAAYYLAMAYENSGQLDEGRRAYQWVVEHRGSTFTPSVESGLLRELCSLQRDVVALAERRAARLLRAVGPGASR